MKVNFNDWPSVKRTFKSAIDWLYYADEDLITNDELKESIRFRLACYLADYYEEVMSEEDIKLKVDCDAFIADKNIIIHERGNDDYNILYLKVCDKNSLVDAKLKVEEKVKEKDFKYGACFDIEKEFRNSRFEIYQNNTWEYLYKET